ncbi:hypothetical protein [Dyadobacter sp. CY356]|uniref:hypothetical protein n=1 Tax=Dyadobacter sp. CY356 TaxID=2906442 RepID=UPI001F43E970|nr:hypothetical protein [Dyadobacter sp. CY356]MCF0055531.1 hypothetical protein [Dyadobacter sp. CY356]
MEIADALAEALTKTRVLIKYHTKPENVVSIDDEHFSGEDIYIKAIEALANYNKFKQGE